MSISVSARLRLSGSVDVVMDGKMVFDPGDASRIRITAILGTPWILGILGGENGRVLIVTVVASGTVNVAHYYDSEATAAPEESRIACESGTFQIIQNTEMFLIYVDGLWRHIR